MTNLLVARAFDKAAHSYDAAAEIQAQVAQTLVATASFSAPKNILDIGCGTGFVLTQAAARWPDAELTGLDIAPVMLREAMRKIPRLTTLRADAGSCELDQRFDLIFSSMMLHWFPHPAEMLRRWRRWLKPQGVLCLAVPVAGSLGAWRDLCEAAGLRHGLWPFPPADFANGLTRNRTLKRHGMTYGSVLEFLRALKRSGGDTPREGHLTLSPAALRNLLVQSPRPFRICYDVLYAQVNGPALDSGNSFRFADGRIGR